MSAEALLGVVFENLLSLVKNEFSNLSGIKGKTEKLSTTLDLIKAVLEDAEEKQVTDPAIKVWLKQLKHAVYVLDDILDECSIESHRLRGLSSYKPKNIKFRHEIGSRLKEIIGRFDKIAEDKAMYSLSKGVREKSSEVPEWRQTFSMIEQPQVYGRDGDKQKIVEFLLNQAASSESLSIYPIVGLGGLGKTTLAQMVYNDERVSTHFNIKIWICVSENFSIHSIFCSIIESITGNKHHMLNLDVMARKVQEQLQSKRYLIVLDDVWKENQQLKSGLNQDKWNKLKIVLSCGSKGASILVSTRDENVAAIMGTCQDHHLSGLSENDCWLLFRQCAFGPNKEERAELVEIGKDIARKCRGSPLAARALGAMMRFKNGKKEWREVKESPLWTLEDQNDILPALRLSYIILTPTLKQCFAFCAIFPKDTVINKEDLIHLWMANGFISSRANLEVEDVGNMIWDELRQKLFFQDIETDDFGDISFKMHDLIHDLAQSLMEEECMVLDEANINHLSKNLHHVAFAYDLSLNESALDKVESLRTLYQIHDYGRISGCFPTNCSLRALRISSFKLPSLRNLIHLRYLELIDFLKIETLPNAICRLRKLEILKLRGLLALKHLPEHLSDLQNVRHLIISRCYSLSHMFPNIRKLCCLRTLSVYIVGLERGHSLAELRDLNLGRELIIEGLQNVGSVSEAQEANLKSKQDLTQLELFWDCSVSDATKDEQVLTALQPPSNLKTLRINSYKGLHFPSWIGNNTVLCNLVDLKISNCSECRQLPSIGKLPSLRKLSINGLGVQYLDDDESYDGVEVKAFLSLETLGVSSCRNLERFLKVEGGEMFPRLSHVVIINCPKLVFTCIPYLERLYIQGCNNEILRSISSMKNLASLKYLTIWEFPELKELPNELMKLNALEKLSIRRCGGLRSLPEGVQHLTSLKDLYIGGCPVLEKRCEKITGEDWHKIAHIPNVCVYP